MNAAAPKQVLFRRPARPIPRNARVAVGALAGAALLAGCSSTPTQSATTTTTTTTTTVPAHVTTPTIAMETPTGGEFLSPSGNISCEIDDNKTIRQTYCETIAQARSVTMSLSGTVHTCSGQKCLSNAGVNTPTLAYGTATGIGPFRCSSARTGVTCTVTPGRKGFTIAGAGITLIGS